MKAAVKQSTHNSAAVIGEDVDFAVLLIASIPPTQDTLMLKPTIGKTKTWLCPPNYIVLM